MLQPRVDSRCEERPRERRAKEGTGGRRGKKVKRERGSGVRDEEEKTLMKGKR